MTDPDRPRLEWDEFTLGELLRFSNGINAPKSAYGHGTPFINVLEVVQRESLHRRDIPGRVSLPQKVLGRYQVRRGDVLFNRTSETQDEVGLTSVYLGNDPVVFGGFILRGRPTTRRLDENYSKYALREQSVRRQIVARGQGGIRANIGQRDLRSVRLRLPEPDEQRVIAEALADVSKLGHCLELSLTKAESVKRGMMQELLTGPVRGSAHSWRTVSINDVARKFSGYWGAARGILEVPSKVIRAGDISAENRIVGYASRSLTKAQYSRAECLPNDVLLTTSGTIGNVALVRSGGLSASNFVRGLRPTADILGGYLYFSLQAHHAKIAMSSHLGISAMPNLGSGFFSETFLPLPSIPEQRALVGALEDADTKIASLQIRLAKVRAIKTGMMQGLLTGRIRLPVEVRAP